VVKSLAARTPPPGTSGDRLGTRQEQHQPTASSDGLLAVAADVSR